MTGHGTRPFGWQGLSGRASGIWCWETPLTLWHPSKREGPRIVPVMALRSPPVVQFRELVQAWRDPVLQELRITCSGAVRVMNCCAVSTPRRQRLRQDCGTVADGNRCRGIGEACRKPRSNVIAQRLDPIPFSAVADLHLLRNPRTRLPQFPLNLLPSIAGRVFRPA